ncbi:hypothetical protein BDQ17DRAFT_1352780 [Cyathus striatus]|nr:hypothetical protein BDQ17DRAFT_1352780 [Cyathus striatus]
MALVQQYKAKEVAFLEASKPTAAPKKKTREDIVKELKAKRAHGKVPAADVAPSAEEEAQLLEEAKKQGKFKPIGWKPVGGSAESKKKKIKEDVKDGERKMKKRKVDKGATKVAPEKIGTAELAKIPPPSSVARDSDKEQVTRAVEPETKSLDEDFDIFADAGEYQGLDLGDDDEEGEEGELRKASDTNMDEEEPTVPHRWIPTDDELIPVQPTSRSEPPVLHSPVAEAPEIEEGEEERPIRLQPLASSAVPSIKDLLAMDQATAAWEKKKKKKDKKKAGAGADADDSDGESNSKKRSAEAKVDRDYKRLKSYTERKGGDSGAR